MIYDRIAEVLNFAAKQAHQNACEHGFYDDIENVMDYLNVNDQPKLAEKAHRDFVLAQLAKIASEVGECVEAIQKNLHFDGLSEELADITIRTMDLSDFLGYHHGNDVAAKMERNSSRPRLHGKLC